MYCLFSHLGLALTNYVINVHLFLLCICPFEFFFVWFNCPLLMVESYYI